MSTSVNQAALQRRLEQLREKGLERFEPVLRSLDTAKTELSPSSQTELEKRSFNELLRITAHFNREQGLLKLSVRTLSNGQLVAGLLLPSSQLAEYFYNQACIEDDPNEPLGVKSLCGVLQHHRVASLALFAPHSREAQQRIDLHQHNFQRGFRLQGSKTAVLRTVIDRALWGYERVLMPNDLVTAYNDISPQRIDYLSDQGLILLPDERREHFELFIPGQARERPSVDDSTLDNLVYSLRRRIRKSANGTNFNVTRRSPEERVRKVFDFIETNRLMSHPGMRLRLAQEGIAYRLQGEHGDTFQGILFYFDDAVRPDTVPAEAPAVEQMKAAQVDPLVAAREHAGNFFGRDVPVVLNCLINHVRISQRRQGLPDDSRSRRFLQQPGIADYLEERGVFIETQMTEGEEEAQEKRYLSPLRERHVDETS